MISGLNPHASAVVTTKNEKSQKPIAKNQEPEHKVFSLGSWFLALGSKFRINPLCQLLMPGQRSRKIKLSHLGWVVSFPASQPPSHPAYFPPRRGGFTLIETIITITVAAIMGTIIFAYLGTPFIQSSTPLNQANKAFTLQKIIENVTSDFMKAPTDLVGLNTKIGPENSDQNNAYGQYSVVYNHFIKFVNETEAPDTSGANTILKVALKNNLGENLTVLFTPQ